MKKYLFYFLAVFCSLSLFSCSDDDDDPDPTPPGPSELIAWEDCAATYGEDNVLVINNETVRNGSTLVTLAVGDNDNAKFTLVDVVEDERLEDLKEIVIDGVTMTKGTSTYTFSGEKAVTEELAVKISGELTPGVVTKDVGPTQAVLKLSWEVVEIDAPIPGVTAWKLNIDEGAADFRIDAQTGVPMIDAMLPMAGSMVGAMIGQKVDDVTLEFTDNGLFNFSWRKVGDSADTDLIDVLKEMMQNVPGVTEETLRQMMQFYYFEEGDQIFIGLSQTALGMMFSMPIFEGIEFSDLAGLLIQKDDKYYLPIHVTKDENSAVFSMDKDMITGFLPILAPFLSGIELGGMDISQIAQIIPNAQKFDISLGFSK